MRWAGLICAVWLPVGAAGWADGTAEAIALLARVRSVAEGMKNWRADVVETSQITGGGMNLR